MNKPNNNLLICRNCQGAGFVGRAKCGACHGMGAGIFSGKYFLYWGGARTASDVPVKKLKRLLNKLIDAGLILFGIFGLVNLGYQGYLSGFTNTFAKNFWTTPNRHLLLFFLALLGILYFAARSTKVAHYFENPLRLDAPKETAGLAWKDVKKYKPVDVAKSFSLHSEQAVEFALLLAKKYRADVLPEFLFLALLKMPKVKIIFGRLGIAAKTLETIVRRNLVKGGESNAKLGADAAGILLCAYMAAAAEKNKKARSNLLMLETVKASEFLQEVLYDSNVDLEKLQNVAAWIAIQDKLRDRWIEFRRASLWRPKGGMNRAMTALQSPILNRFSDDLTEYAGAGLIDICLGREEIFSQMFRVIESGGRGVILVGERGVGKSAIMDGLAELMLKDEAPKRLRDKRLVRLRLADILGGASQKEAGERLFSALSDAYRAGNIVLEISNLEFFASAENLALVPLLAEGLSRFRLPIFASTTPEGYRQTVEESALHGVFERLDVPEPDANLAIQILEAESGAIEYRERVYFSYDAISGAVKLSDKYLHERFLPDKAIEIIRETALAVREKRGAGSIINYEDVAGIVSEKSRVPIGSITESEKEKLLKMEEILRTRIIGQREAVEAVSSALRRARSGLREGKRPIANFLFLGPTGVGKTELAKTIADVYFGDENNMIRVDMSEYQEKSGAAKMIGSAGEAGGLTEAVRQKPFALLLLDELEKAHPDILNLFLQVMEDGRLTDGRGRTIDFTNVILVATSNAGSDFIAKEVGAGASVAEIKEKLLSEKLGAYFKPEFLNRFDGVIVFAPLTSEETVKIAGLMIKKVAKGLEAKGVELVFEDKALRELAEAGYDPKFGARPLRRVISREVLDRLANMLLKGEVKRRDKIVFHDLENAEIMRGREI